MSGAGKKRTQKARDVILSIASGAKQPEKEEVIYTDYDDLIAKASIENNLSEHGYTLLNRLVITDSEQGKAQYLKTVNKYGQVVYVLVDVEGFTTTKDTDLMLTECDSNPLPHSLKVGACDLARNDVYGIVLESGTDMISVISRDEDLQVNERSYTFTSPRESFSDVLTYPLIRLSELRSCPDLVLEMADTVTRRLRNAAYTSVQKQLQEELKSAEALFVALSNFAEVSTHVASKLAQTVQLLDEWNKIYIETPPVTDEGKEKYRKLKFNLAHRNAATTSLLHSMKLVSEHKKTLDRITTQVAEVTDVVARQFANVEYVLEE